MPALELSRTAHRKAPGRWLRPGTTRLSLAGVLLSSLALAAPEAHLLRVDPRTAVLDGNPVLTTVIDLSQSKRVGEVTSVCAELRGTEQLTCMSDALEKPRSLAEPYPFPERDVLFSIRVGDTDFPSKLLGTTTFGKSQNEPGVGTAWLVVIDADERMDDGFDEANILATQLVDSMGPQDLVNVIYISDRQVVSDTKWLTRGEHTGALAAIQARSETIRSQGRTRPLLDLIKRAATDSFRALTSSPEAKKAPLHQAMVVISSGFGGGDPGTSGPGASKLAEYFTSGRFDDQNTALPKMPIPVISVYVPPKAMPEHQQMALSFMENLSNPSIGGFFTVLQNGQGSHASRIVESVRGRFADLIIARFRLSCVAPTATQSFSLLFKKSSILGDSTFRDVPVGFDPSEWPLDIDVELTRKTAEKKGGIYPGGELSVFGNFCWGGDATRPEVYFLPPGESLPHDLSESADAASQVQKRLTSLDMRASAMQSSGSFAKFRVPDAEQILHGKGDRRVVRIVIVDSTLRRTSGLTEATVVTLKGGDKATPLWKYAALAGVAVAFALGLLGIFLRRGTRRLSTIPPRSRSLSDESPYATPSVVSRIPKHQAPQMRATLEGTSGLFTVLPSSDLRFGRDGSRATAVLYSPQVSGLHATFRIQEGKLLVRDEGSSSGTRIGAMLIEPGTWREVADGVEVSLGPEVLRVAVKHSS